MFVEVNCAAIPEDFIESELFGHRQGAFSSATADKEGKFQKADGGTLFLDEVGDMSLKTQSKVLRTLDEGRFAPVGEEELVTVDARVIAATNKDLEDEISKGNFREDLFYRLNVIPFYVPPLRERKEDIPLLAHHFLRQSAQRYRKHLEGFEPVALQILLDHPWPGNIRELDHSVERAVLMAEGSAVRASDLGLRPAREASLRLDEMSIEDVERVLIQKALARFGGNVSHASKALGLSRSALYRRLQKYSL
jgi:DNA-binding NtrC family response regulator